jgi:hypothetical protein
MEAASHAVAEAAYAVAEASDMGDTHAVGETGVGAPTLMGLVARLASPRTTRAGTDGLRDSPLGGDGFELSVPGRKRVRPFR